jgi:hypothetical protein
MLTEIIRAFRETEGPLNTNDLSRRLGVQPSALEGMLQTLVRQGKLREIDLGSQDCAFCNNAGCSHCSDVPLGKAYELAEPAEGGG